jgi:hypothetical protein
MTEKQKKTELESKLAKIEYRRLYIEKNKERLVKQSRAYYYANREKINAKSREYYHKNKEAEKRLCETDADYKRSKLEYMRNYRLVNRERIYETRKIWELNKKSTIKN